MLNKLILLAGVSLLLSSCGGGSGGSSAAPPPPPPPPPPPANQFSLSSAAFPAQGTIPIRHVCAGQGGADLSPAMSWANLPANTASLVLIMDDENPPCAAGNGACRHWSVFNIPSTVFGLPDSFDATTIAGVTEGVNFTGANGYAGPCPPGLHTYTFTLYAMAATAPTFPTTTSVTRSSFAQINAADILASVSLIASFP